MNNSIQNIFGLLVTLAIALSFAGCSKEIDNREYPSSVVSGRFIYNGQPVQILGTATEDDNMLQLTQTGPGTWNPGFIKMFAREDGTFTINTFDGDYYLRITPGRGPWVPNNDTVRFNLSSKKEGVTFNVTPYFWISNYASAYTDSVFTASFDLNKVVSTAGLERVVVYFGNTAIVDNVSRIVERGYTTLQPGSNRITVDLKTLTSAEKVSLAKTGLLFARVGVKTQGVRDLIFSRTVELKR